MKGSWSISEIHKFIIDILNNNQVIPGQSASEGDNDSIVTSSSEEEGEEEYHEEEQFTEEDIEAGKHHWHECSIFGMM